MGHIRLGSLPRTRKWRQVVALLEGNAGTAEIAGASMAAAAAGLRDAAQDPGLVHALWLLTQLPLAARSDKFIGRLRELGFRMPDEPTLLDVTAGLTAAVDEHLKRVRGRSDLGEMAEMAAVESLGALLAERTRSLFGTTTRDVQGALGQLATVKQFGLLARDYFARFTRRYLTYFLSRELSNHVGGDGRFANIERHTEFLQAFDEHCRQAARIVERFAGEWLSKTSYVEGEITPEKAAQFAHVALKKIEEEILRGAQE